MKLSPAPIRNPIVEDAAGIVPKVWSAWFRQLGMLGLVSDTMANRPPAGRYPDGTMFYATDRNSFWIVVGQDWRYLGGIMIDVIGNRPTGLGLNDVGFIFQVSDWLSRYIWDGSAWQSA